ncbi:hypothetical protein PHSY_001219 [Pseudozyma hubeiensis SY62]|uniref:Uncharacterized protein n=1 Tax=Pseudozyma hubeiensis (strain SY62) TaxID=1305764 RepID=R9NY94_PSEHS|nr:hypothetical protein PHSY_001219 [Pseudozyma hubeiensis SY62]GAC93654.1 hypothetical protein PHSY_001219 [Pseudozyma hubeiensis SY62]
MMDASAQPPVKRKPGRPRKVQPQIDFSLPLHPWATAHTQQQQQQQQQQQHTYPHQSASTPASTSYHSAQRLPSQPQPKHRSAAHQQQPHHHATSSGMPPPQGVPMTATVAAVPVPAATFYAQQQQPVYGTPTHARAKPGPKPKLHAQSVPPKPESELEGPRPTLLRKNLPTPADLDFLLGGSSKARARSIAPSSSIDQSRKHTLASKASSEMVNAEATRDPTSAIENRRFQLSASTRTPLHANVSATASDDKHSQAAVRYMDDDLPLGAEAVMEPEHDAGSSFEADVEDAREKDDPNDRDFRPYGRPTAAKRSVRKSQVPEKTAAILGGTDNLVPKRKRGRPSLASTTGKVPGSDILPTLHARTEARAHNPDDTPDQPKRRGRPPKYGSDPELLHYIEEANRIIAIARNEPERLTKKPKLDDVVDVKLRKVLPDHLRTILLRAKDTMNQRERRHRRALAEAEAQGIAANNSPQDASRQQGNDPIHTVVKLEKRQKDKRRLAALDDERMETGSGSSLIERARGKVSEWIKSISSEAELSVDADELSASGAKWFDEEDDDDDEATSKPTTVSRQGHRLNRAPSSASSSKQHFRALQPSRPDAASPQPAAEGDDHAQASTNTEVDPRLHQSNNQVVAADDEEDTLVQGYFSRFGTVTGADKSASAPKTSPEAVGTQSKQGGAAEAPTFEAGVVGDEYYFSN